MKPRHIDGSRSHAAETLRGCNIHVGQKYSTLTSGQRDMLSAIMFSRRTVFKGVSDQLQMFYDMLQRQAKTF